VSFGLLAVGVHHDEAVAKVGEDRAEETPGLGPAKKSLDPLGFVLFKRLKQRKEEQMITLFTPQSGT
jgi:hypothetical protein